VCCTLSAYTSYAELTNKCCRLLMNLDFCFKALCSMCLPRAETQAARRLRYCFMALSISCWSILSHLLLWFLQERHNYVTAQRIFYRFCQNQITISWHIHLQIFAEIFIKCVKNVRNILKNKCITFFWTRCTHTERRVDRSISLNVPYGT